jgi:hypothetical protein
MEVLNREEAGARPQLMLVKTQLQKWLGKKYCDEAELLTLLLAGNIVRRVSTINVEIAPLSGDSFKVALDSMRPLVSEAKAAIARQQGTPEAGQELYRVATRPDGCGAGEDVIEPDTLYEDDMELRDGEVVTLVVKDVFVPLHERTIEGHTDEVHCLVMHGNNLISGSNDNTIKVWNTDTWECEHTVKPTDPMTCMVMHGDKLISGSRDIVVWNTDTWTCERTLTGHNDTVNCLVIYGNTLISGSYDSTIKVWSTDTWGACERTLKQHARTGVLCLVMLDDKLISSSDNSVIKVWSTSTWECEHTIDGLAVEVDSDFFFNQHHSLVMHGDKLISSSCDGNANPVIRVWNTDTWECEHTIDTPGSTVTSLVMHGGNLISSDKLKVWSTDTWTCEAMQPDGHTDGTEYTLCMVMHGVKLITGTSNGDISVWGSYPDTPKNTMSSSS